MGTLTPKIIGIKILNSFKFKKEKEAKKEVLELLKHKNPEPDVNIKNESGWQPLHYAASYGFVDLVEVLCDKGAEANGRDLNSQTPLHKAASRGYPEVVVALVARGATVDTLDWHGQTPLELAVMGRFVVVMEILFRLGADYKLHDYSWAQKEKLDKTELEMKELIKQQVAKYPGYKNKGIMKELHYMDPKKGDGELELTDLNLTVKTSKMNQPYYLYCSKVQSEYSNLKRYLAEEQKPFSDMFECMYRGETSSKKKQEFIFVIKLNAQPPTNEEIVFVSPLGKVGKIIDINVNHQETDGEKDEEDVNHTENNQEDETLEEITYVTVAVQIEQKQMVSFALALKEKEPEVFAISKEAVKITPESEPDAEIDIPENAFDDPGELCLKVTESKSVNEEREDGNLLATNVLDMSMSNKQQPKEGKGIALSLPIHTYGDTSAEEEMCVITTSEEYPENEDDWEVIPAKKVKGKHGSALSFTATHFSIFVGASLEKIKKNKAEVTSGAQRSIYGTKKIVIFTLMKLKNKLDASYAVIVECATKKKAKKRIQSWSDKEKYFLKEESDEIEVSENQIFKVHFDGNVLFHGGTDVFTLAYESKRKENYQIYDFTVKDRNGEGYSKVIIEAESEVEEKEEKPKLQPVVIKTGIFCTEVVQVPIESTKQEPKLEYKEVANLKMQFDIPKLPKPKIPEAKKDEAKVPEPTEDNTLLSTELMDMKDEAMIPVLKYVSLRSLSTILTLNDVENMASKLGVSAEIVEGIKYSDNIQDDFMKVFKILDSWRGIRPGAYKVDILVEALMHIGKEDLAGIIKSSAENKTYPSFFN